MVRISSGSTRFYKYFFPVVWGGFVGLSLLAGIAQKHSSDRVAALLIPGLMIAFAFLLFKRLLWVLADEVYDCGDHLIIKNRGLEERVDLSNIMNVSCSFATNPPRCTLRLVKPGLFGQEIVFTPVRPFTLNPFSMNAIAEDLMVRAHSARSAKTR